MSGVLGSFPLTGQCFEIIKGSESGPLDPALLASKRNKKWSFLSQGELERANTARLLLRYGWVRIDTETREKERGRERDRVRKGSARLLSLSLFFPCLSDTRLSPFSLSNSLQPLSLSFIHYHSSALYFYSHTCKSILEARVQFPISPRKKRKSSAT